MLVMLYVTQMLNVYFHSQIINSILFSLYKIGGIINTFRKQYISKLSLKSFH